MMKSVIWWRKPEYPEETTDLRQVTDEWYFPITKYWLQYMASIYGFCAWDIIIISEQMCTLATLPGDILSSDILSHNNLSRYILAADPDFPLTRNLPN